MRRYRITETRAGGLRLAILENGVEVAGGGAPTRSDEDRAWLIDQAADLGAFDELDEGEDDAKSTP